MQLGTGDSHISSVPCLTTVGLNSLPASGELGAALGMYIQAHMYISIIFIHLTHLELSNLMADLDIPQENVKNNVGQPNSLIISQL